MKLILPAALLLALVPATGFAKRPGKDVTGGRDHPLISRYEGSVIVKYSQAEFDRLTVALGPFDTKTNAQKTQVAEGRVTRISYAGPVGRSVLEVLRNYESSLSRAGFKILARFDSGKDGHTWKNHFRGNNCIWSMKERMHLVAEAVRGEKSLLVQVVVAPDPPAGECKPVGIQLDVVERKAIELGKVTVSADEIQRALDEQGHIAIYGIYFDTGSARIKPESDATLEQIARVLSRRPQLRLNVVGHTDSTGDLEQNMQLSRERAASAVQALAQRFRIEPSRLAAHGVGPLSPVASNRQESTRARNRRVELIER